MLSNEKPAIIKITLVEVKTCPLQSQDGSTDMYLFTSSQKCTWMSHHPFIFFPTCTELETLGTTDVGFQKLDLHLVIQPTVSKHSTEI